MVYAYISRKFRGVNKEFLPNFMKEEYWAWSSMQTRCKNKNDKRVYPGYGGRGIKVCQGYVNSFELFLRDVGDRPSESHSIDRVNNNLGYVCGKCSECKENGWEFNLRWATKKEQARNRRSSVFWSYKGESKTLPEWAEICGIEMRVLWNRIHRDKWSFERAIISPRRGKEPTPWQKKQQDPPVPEEDKDISDDRTFNVSEE